MKNILAEHVSLSHLLMSYVTAASNPVETSSQHATGLCPTIISPTVTRRRCPPDTPLLLASPTYVSLHTAKSRPSMVRFSERTCVVVAVVSRSSFDGAAVFPRRQFAANSNVSFTVKKGA